MSEPTCIRCQIPQSGLANPLKRCARCRQAQYCSVDCQRVDWPEHKLQCTKTITPPDTTRRSRMTFGRRRERNFSDANIIRFVRKTVENIDDITMAGPFHNLESTMEHMKGMLLNISQQGFIGLCEQDEIGDTFLGRIEHIRTPLDEDPTQFVLLEIIEEKNSTMAGRLPGPSFNVFSTVPFLPQDLAERDGHVRSPYPRVKRVDVHGSFPSLEEANTEANRVIADFKQRFREVQDVPHNHDRDHNYIVHTIIDRDQRNQLAGVAVEVRFDSGEVRYI